MKRSFILAVGWTVGIGVLCSLPGNALPPSPYTSFDKLVHLVLFALFGILWGQALAQRRWSGHVFVGGVIYGTLIELYQDWLIPGRFADPFDAVADTLGLTVGILALMVWQNRY